MVLRQLLLGAIIVLLIERLPVSRPQLEDDLSLGGAFDDGDDNDEEEEENGSVTCDKNRREDSVYRVCGPNEPCNCTLNPSKNDTIKLDCAGLRTIDSANLCPTSNLTKKFKISEVRLQHNVITELITKEVVGGYQDEIELMDLSSNHIRDVHDNSFQGFSNLKVLDLRDNLIDQLRGNSFNDLQNLEVLDLSNNRLTDLPGDTFQPLVKLRVLYLSGNPITKLDNRTFSSLHKLEKLYLDGAKLETVHDEWLIGLNKLKYLSLHRNNFQVVPVLHGLPSLHTLDISGNPITTIDSNSFLSLRTLKEVDLSESKRLKSIASCAFCGLLNLQVLQIDGCSQLEHIDPMAFQQPMFTKSMGDINLSGNNLTTLPASLLPWQNISQIFLRGNPLNCDCAMQWINNKNLAISDEIICATPLALKGNDARNLSDADFGCEKKKLSKNRAKILVGIMVIGATALTIFAIWQMFFGCCCKISKMKQFYRNKSIPFDGYRNLAMKAERDDLVLSPEQMESNDWKDPDDEDTVYSATTRKG